MFRLVIVWLSIIWSNDTLFVDIDNSQLNWVGRKITGEHAGHIKLSEGWVVMHGNIPVDGLFSIDMASIKNTDIESPEWSLKLENHLKSDDFFSVDSFPAATLYISPFADDKISEQNKHLNYASGSLTICGITHDVSIPFQLAQERNIFVATGSIEIDRTLYNINYKSGKFFNNLGDKMIYDDFTIEFMLVTKEVIAR